MSHLKSQSIHKRIKILLQETNDAFTNYHTVNADYAEFASLSLSEFRSILKQPNLDTSELIKVLRHSTIQHRKNNPEGCWATFVAKSITEATNSNLRTAVQSMKVKKLKQKIKQKAKMQIGDVLPRISLLKLEKQETRSIPAQMIPDQTELAEKA